MWQNTNILEDHAASIVTTWCHNPQDHTLSSEYLFSHSEIIIFPIHEGMFIKMKYAKFLGPLHTFVLNYVYLLSVTVGIGERLIGILTKIYCH